MMTNTLAYCSVVSITALKSFFNSVAANRSKRYKMYALIYKKILNIFFCQFKINYSNYFPRIQEDIKTRRQMRQLIRPTPSKQLYIYSKMTYPKHKEHWQPTCKASKRGRLSMQPMYPTVWLNRARPANTFIPPSFPGNTPAQLCGAPTPKIPLRVLKN
jgi:hypothetical protein